MARCWHTISITWEEHPVFMKDHQTTNWCDMTPMWNCKNRWSEWISMQSKIRNKFYLQLICLPACLPTVRCHFNMVSLFYRIHILFVIIMVMFVMFLSFSFFLTVAVAADVVVVVFDSFCYLRINFTPLISPKYVFFFIAKRKIIQFFFLQNIHIVKWQWKKKKNVQLSLLLIFVIKHKDLHAPSKRIKIFYDFKGKIWLVLVLETQSKMTLMITFCIHYT